jgi:hypothetical protein
MFFQVEVKCLEDKNIDFRYTQCVFFKHFFRPIPTWAGCIKLLITF